MKAELIIKYEQALEKSKTDEKLSCQTNQIQETLDKLNTPNYNPTVLDEVWVDYFNNR